MSRTSNAPQILLAALLVLPGCGIIERPTDTGTTGSFTVYTGEERYVFAYNPGGEVDCTLSWATSGTPALVSCLDCVFAFDVTLTIDEDQSVDNGACVDRHFSFQETYLLVEDDSGRHLARWSGSAPEILGDATFNEATGSFRYAYGDDGYSYGSYYYTQYTAGSAQVQ